MSQLQKKGLNVKGITVSVDPLARALVLDMLGNIVLMLETGKDPMQVAQEIRNYIARHDDAVRRALPKIPTMAQIERWRMIVQAEKENRERDTQIAAHRAQVRRNVLREALSNYPSLGARDAEHLEMAARILREIDR